MLNNIKIQNIYTIKNMVSTLNVNITLYDETIDKYTTT